MKKIFYIEINDKDKKYEDKEVVDRINNLISNIAIEISNEKEVFIQLKRVGNTWDNIVDATTMREKNTKVINKNKIKNHLKLIK
tara:strand:+ start:329 stop:580 length:252 start_codon:yes stop_codon:yes gene_type:complete